jgi:hypothetical protein
MCLSFKITPYLYGFPTNADTQSYIQSVFYLSGLNNITEQSVSVDTSKGFVTFCMKHNDSITTDCTLTVDFTPLSAVPMFQSLTTNYVQLYPNNNFTSIGQAGYYYSDS